MGGSILEIVHWYNGDWGTDVDGTLRPRADTCHSYQNNILRLTLREHPPWRFPDRMWISMGYICGTDRKNIKIVERNVGKIGDEKVRMCSDWVVECVVGIRYKHRLSCELNAEEKYYVVYLCHFDIWVIYAFGIITNWNRLENNWFFYQLLYYINKICRSRVYSMYKALWALIWRVLFVAFSHDHKSCIGKFSPAKRIIHVLGHVSIVQPWRWWASKRHTKLTCHKRESKLIKTTNTLKQRFPKRINLYYNNIKHIHLKYYGNKTRLLDHKFDIRIKSLRA